MIKKFKNGKVVLSKLKKEIIDESFYHDDMFWKDLYIQQINGYLYLVDFNTSLVYNMGSYLLQNPLKYLIDSINSDGKITFYPLPKKVSNSLLQDLENGY